MASKAFAIIEAFAAAPSAADRQQAPPALAALATPESIARLTALALADQHPEVRQRAEAEVQQLAGPALATAIQQLLSALNGQQGKQQQVNAYGLLGRLRAAGHEVPRASLPWRTKLRLAWSLNGYLYAPRTWQHCFRAWKWGLGGAVLGVLYCAVFAPLVTHFERDETMLTRIGIAAGALALGSLIAILPTQRTSPINLQLRRGAATVVELLTTTLIPFVIAAAIALFIAFLFWLFGQELTWKEVRYYILGSLALCSLLIGLTRAGTLLGGGLFQQPPWNRLGPALLGFMPALLGALAILYYFWAEPYRAAARQHGARFAMLNTHNLAAFLTQQINPANPDRDAWLLFIPLALGIAYAFSVIDSESAPRRPLLGSLAIPVNLLLTVIFSATLLASLYLGYQAKQTHFTGYHGRVNRLVFSADSSLLAASAESWNDLRIWEMGSRSMLLRLREPPYSITALAFSPNRNLLALGDSEGNVEVRERRTGQVKTKQQVKAKQATYRASILSMTFSADEKMLVVGSENGSLAVLNLTGDLPALFQNDQFEPTQFVLFLPPSPHFLCVSRNSVRRYDFPSLRLVEELLQFDSNDLPKLSYSYGSRGAVMVVSANGRFIAALTEKNALQFWDLEQRQKVWASSGDRLLRNGQAPVRLALSAEGNLLALTFGSNSGSNSWEVWETNTQRVLSTSERISQAYPALTFYDPALAFSPDGKYLAVGTDNFVRLLESAEFRQP